MKKSLTILLLLIANSMFANVIFYKTYQDFVQKKGQDMGELKEIQQSGSYGTSFIVIKDGKKEKYANSKLNAYWCIEVDGILFKVFGKYNGMLFEIVHVGNKVFCFENANTRLEAMNSGNSNYKPASSKFSIIYFATKADAMPEMLTYSFKGKIKESLRKDFPELSTLFDKMEEEVAKNRRRTGADFLNDFKEFDK